MSSFFSFFPTMLYSNTVATNVLAKVAFQRSALNNIVQYYPYTIENNERADAIAQKYYGDYSYDWLVYMSNDIVDPANEWYKTQNQLDDLIDKKYGSFVDALARVKYYKVNYDADNRIITTAAYASLTAGQKKYWAPNLDDKGTVVGYKRAVLDWNIENFNSLELTGTFNGIVRGDLVKQSASITGEVVFANTTAVTIKNVTGTWATGSVYYATTGVQANATISSVTSITSVLPVDEAAYWTPVSAYDYETELNESRRNIILVGASYVNNIERDMRDLM